ncbi:MAG: hypothetical protein JNK65_02050 [Deltaproteobacteria bacterium]|nr:hypothetical protein [Deltaproteobacteria bacterium]
MKKALLFFAVLFVINGCGYKSQVVPLKAASLEGKCQVQGKGKKIHLIVKDERNSSTLGTRMAGGGGKLKTDGSEMATLESALKQGFQSCGYELSASSSSELDIQLRDLSYSLAVGFWRGRINISAVTKAEIKKSGKVMFEKMVREEREEKRATVPTSKENIEDINQVFNNLVYKIVNDLEIANAL